MKRKPELRVTFGAATFRAGTPFSCVVHLSGGDGDGGGGACAVLWRATGWAPGESMIMHEIEIPPGPDVAVPVDCKLPLVPVTYEGQTFKVEWLLRVQIFGEGDEVEESEHLFEVA